MKRVVLFSLVVLPLAALLAYSLTRDARDLPSTLIAKPAPDFQLKTLDGKEVRLKNLTGKTVVINFWASWCYPCMEEHPVFGLAKKAFEKENVVFLGVIYQDTKEAIRKFITQYGEATLTLEDPDSRTAIDYGVGGVPETFFVDAQGIIRHKYKGALTFETLKEGIHIASGY